MKMAHKSINSLKTPDNILVSEDDPGRIVGIIDFGDMVHTLLIIDLATTIVPMLHGHVAHVSHCHPHVVEANDRQFTTDDARIKLNRLYPSYLE